jgi:predicted cupin superfamily sugar epimerase
MKTQQIIDLLQLKPHPKERGYFTETYRSRFSTAIYFLLTAEGFSEMHRLKSDEVFHFYNGASAELLLLMPDGKGELLKFGNSIDRGERPQIVIPAGSWQGMRTTGEYTLLGCTVSPAFEYADYEKGSRKELIQRYPEFAEKIKQLTDPDESS